MRFDIPGCFLSVFLVIGLLPGCMGEGGDIVSEDCADSADNDGDDYIDCEDQDCWNTADCPSGDDDDSTSGDDDDSASGDDDDTGSNGIDDDGDGFIEGNGDCDDSDPTVHSAADEICDDIDHNCDGDTEAGATDTTNWYRDLDGDGFGEDAELLVACSGPANYSSHGGDCDDDNPAFHPGATEADCTDPADYNCDGQVGYTDADTDSYPACEDCNDNDAAVNSAATETCNSVDDDCDGQIDEGGASGESLWYLDADGDGYGRGSMSVLGCQQPAGYVAVSDDCDDLDPTSYPGATEVCDEADNNCDNSVDEGAAAPGTWYADADGDSFGNAAASLTACAAPFGTVATAGDCDDLDASSFPGGTEVCDGADNNCDSSVDEGVTTTFFTDSDGDGYGDPGSPVQACFLPAGASTSSLDCDDGAPAAHPGGIEICDGLDNDCDSSVDIGALDASSFFVDADGDGYGDPTTAQISCNPGSGSVANGADCDDTPGTGNATSPAATETCDGIDNNCSGGIDEGFDGDGDGVNSCGPDGVAGNSDDDCNDGPGGALFYPGASESCGDPDYSCDGVVPPVCVPPPALDSISPDSGYTVGGYTITLTGSDFLSAATVTIGGVAATNVTVIDANTCTVTVPASSSEGAVDVTLTNTDGQFDSISAGFTYTESPYAIATFTENQGVPLTDYAVRLDISGHSGALSGGFSVVEANGSSVDYCFEVQGGPQEGECTASYTDFIWVKLPSLSASGTLELSVVPGSNTAGTGLDVFEVYEDFQDTIAAPGISGLSYNHLSSGYIGMAGSDSYYVGLFGTGLTSSVHKKIDYYQGVWTGESDLTLWLDGNNYGGDIDIYNCPGGDLGARSWTIIKTNEMSYSLCGSSESAASGTFNPSVGSSFEYRHRSNDTDASGMTLTWISMRPYVDNEPSAAISAL